jgi:D-arginine dehydrogenase
MSMFDFAVIGAGIAGASFAARLARRASVLLLEREPFPAYHSTGRSAALFSALYGNETIRCLTRASRAFYASPPKGFAEHALVTPRSIIYVDVGSGCEAVDRLLTSSPLARSISIAQAIDLVPILREDAFTCAALEPSACDIDVQALHTGFLRMAKAGGTAVVTNVELLSLEHRGEWQIMTRSGEYRAAVVVNAAGAWADELARLAGVAPVDLKPLRRTVITVDPPPQFDVCNWPAVIAADESFYFKPDAGRLLASPADETPSAPCDAQPDELDIAVCVDRMERATTLSIRRVVHSWAGLRTFAADRTPVVGYDQNCGGFFWLAGQGGYGIQTAPALSEVAAALALREPVPAYIMDEAFTSAALMPSRLHLCASAERFLVRED